MTSEEFDGSSPQYAGDGSRWPVSRSVAVEWPGSVDPFTGRWRPGFATSATVPARLAEARPMFPADVAAGCEEAARAVGDLNGGADADVAALSVPLLRSEAVNSSRIEGIMSSHRRVVEAAFDPAGARRQALETVRNINAMRTAIELATTGPLTLDGLLQVHAALATGTDLATYGGRLRDEQSWIGPTDDPRDAVYVPPPPTHVADLLVDLLAFMDRTDLPAIAQAAVVHAHFEAIHPFVDGNGRVGRCLIHAVLRRRAIAPVVVPPIALTLLARREEYFAGLQTYAAGSVTTWISQFAEAARAAAVTARSLTADVADAKRNWLAMAGNPRADAISRRIIDTLFDLPVLDIPSVVAHLGANDETARRGLVALAEAEVLTEVTLGRRHRVYECPGVFAILDRFEARVLRRDVSDH